MSQRKLDWWWVRWILSHNMLHFSFRILKTQIEAGKALLSFLPDFPSDPTVQTSQFTFHTPFITNFCLCVYIPYYLLGILWWIIMVKKSGGVRDLILFTKNSKEDRGKVLVISRKVVVEAMNWRTEEVTQFLRHTMKLIFLFLFPDYYECYSVYPCL
jgi:hypothetical protein